MKAVLSILLATILVVGAMGTASAVPRMQTYIEGSNYVNDTWVTSNTDFTLRMAGYWSPNNQPAFEMMDTWLMISVPKGQTGSVWVNGVEITGFNNAVPSAIASNPSLFRHAPVGDSDYYFFYAGTIDNSAYLAHNYGADGFGNSGWGNELAFNISVSGFTGAHFDAVGVSRLTGTTYVNPYSHDAEYGDFSVPEPGTLSLLGLGLLGVAGYLRRRRRED